MVAADQHTHTEVDWFGLRLGSTWHSVCIHQINRVNSRNGLAIGDSTINNVTGIVIRLHLPYYICRCGLLLLTE